MRYFSYSSMHTTSRFAVSFHHYRSLLALFAPGVLFAAGLFLLRTTFRFTWINHLQAWPWELWVIAIAGLSATAGGIADWVFHRKEGIHIGPKEKESEFKALAFGGIPLFILMALASLSPFPSMYLIPVIVVVLYTVVLICYDEFVFHRIRCDTYETFLHRFLVFGNGVAWLAWFHWCFVQKDNYVTLL